MSAKEEFLEYLKLSARESEVEDELFIKTKLYTLYNRLKRWSKAYNVHDAPLVDDAEYDSVFHMALWIEQEYPELRHPKTPTAWVGYPEVEVTFFLENN